MSRRIAVTAPAPHQLRGRHADEGPGETEADEARPDAQRLGRAKRVASCFEVLGNPYRIDMILALAGGEETSGELGAVVGLEPALASYHLKILRRAGIVADARHKKCVWYRLVAATVTPATVVLVHRSGVRITFDLPFPPAGTKGPKK